MSDRDSQDPTDPRLALARKLALRDRVRPNLSGASTAGNSNLPEPQFNLPTGTNGQILAMMLISGMLIPQFVDPPVPIGLSGQYRQYVVISDGAAGFSFLDDGFANPIYTLELVE